MNIQIIMRQMYQHLKLFLLVVFLSTLFEILERGLDYMELDSVIEKVLTIYFFILPILIIERYLQKPTEYIKTKYFLLSSAVSLLAIFAYSIFIIISDPDGFGIFAVFIMPFYVIPVVFIYTLFRMLIWYKADITTNKIQNVDSIFLKILLFIFIIVILLSNV